MDRAFRILGAFASSDRSLSLTSLSVRTGLPKTSTLRLARKLTEWGALERTEDGEYVIGLRLLEVASLAPRGHGLRAIALPHLVDLHHATGHDALLAVREGREAILVERLSADTAVRRKYRVGGRMPLPCTGVGLALLAYAPIELQDEVLTGDLVDAPAETGVSAQSMRARLATVRRRGVAVVFRHIPEPVMSVACPIFGRGHTAVGALSVVCRVSRSAQHDPTTVTPAVVAVARAISRAMTAEPLNAVGHR
ncbi:MAG TPA: IclR family transcriptional regulator [Amycolatopsis sp.]|uniref:IclR family transcriptional regulator n=1 Tax=Amycolatopsis sp. TaxID=37632 RepID=UPI002B4717F6|nr:IclR family transcriptional regulator [Amycolatopsis sp.]HKS50208.1 IclR family transcriptional regulator [Amycolatopsis sp.]